MRATAFAIGLVAAGIAAGCGDDDSEDSGAAMPEKAREPVTVLRLNVVTKPGEITFDKKRLEVPAGPIVIELDDATQLGHNVRIHTGEQCCFAPGHKDLGGTTTGVGKVKGTVNLKPGKYFFLCSVGGHWQLGQRGTLVVE